MYLGRRGIRYVLQAGARACHDDGGMHMFFPLCRFLNGGASLTECRRHGTFLYCNIILIVYLVDL